VNAQVNESGLVTHTDTLVCPSRRMNRKTI
jgi:hypothetical protein